MYWLLFYDVVDDYVERRASYRASHLELAQAAVDRGELVLAGATGDPPGAPLLVFKSDGPAVAEQFAASDPYVNNGVVTAWRVVPWHVVAGAAMTGD